MKLSDEERSEYPDTVMANQPLYPWGLSIQLDDDTLKKLGLKLPNLDQVIEFKCRAQVIAVNSRKDGNDEDESSVSLQITDMELVENDSGDRAAKKLYGDKK